MRCYFNYCVVLIFFLNGVAYSKVNQKITDNQLVTQHVSPFQSHQNSAHHVTDDPLKERWINPKNIYMSANLLYGSISDGGASGTSTVETFSPTGEYNNYISRAGLNFGFLVTLGYKVSSSEHREIIYTRLHTEGNVNTSVERGGFLFNDLTQFGNADIPGFYVLSGPAGAHDQINFGYDSVDLFIRHAWLAAHFARFNFTKLIGFKLVGITKSLKGTYSGLANGQTTSEDEVNYSAHFYGIGPQLGAAGIWNFSKRVKIKGSGMGAFLAGMANSNLNELAVASAPVQVGIPNGTQTLSNYYDNQTHRDQSWTPVLFAVDCSVVIELIDNQAKNFNLTLEGGIASEYILPTFSNGSYTQAVGQQLIRLNDNLNLSAVFIKLASNLD